MGKVIVTGGEGFIGSHLVDKLIDHGHQVYVIDDESAESNEKFYKNDKAIYFKTSINELYEIDYKIFKDADAIFHLAAESRIGPAIANPLKATETNVLGTVRLLQIAKDFNVGKFIYSSTSSVYGLTNELPTHESTKIDCLNPYSATKYAGEEMCRVYHKLYGLNTCILRYFNVYGDRSPTKGQYAPVIGLFERMKYAGESLKVVGDGEQRRDFVNVHDVVQANLKAYFYLGLLNGETFNVGNGYNYSINDIAKQISPNIEYIPQRPGEARHTQADISKISYRLGYTPKYDVLDWINDNI